MPSHLPGTHLALAGQWGGGTSVSMCTGPLGQ